MLVVNLVNYKYIFLQHLLFRRPNTKEKNLRERKHETRLQKNGPGQYLVMC